jgi:flagellin-specific chaperone FliS
MRKTIMLLSLCVAFSKNSCAQVTEIISIVETAIKKALQAADLEVQKIQNQTIWLQDAQKTLENAMSELDLSDITDWVQRIKDLYLDYYKELSEVKQIIQDYDKVKTIVELQERIVSEYNSASALFKQDKHFTASELSYMGQVYSGILDESLKNLDQLLLVVNAFVTQMTDEKRMDIINSASKGMQKNYNDLKQFDNQSILLSLQRSTDNDDLQTVKNLYGLE